MTSETDAVIVDAEKAREKIPGGRDAEKFGENVGKEAGANVDEAVCISTPHSITVIPAIYLVTLLLDVETNSSRSTTPAPSSSWTSASPR